MDIRVIRYTLSILLFLSTSAWAGSLMMMGGGTPVAAGGPTTFPCNAYNEDGEGNSVTLCEDFQGDQHCEDRVAAGSVCRVNHEWVANDACTNEVVYSTNSAYCNESTGNALCSKYTLVTANSINVFSKVKINYFEGLSGASMIFTRIQDAGNMYCGIGIVDAAGVKKFTISDGTVGTDCTNCPTPELDTTYYIWLEWVKGVSCTGYVSTTKTKPTSTANGMVQDTSVISGGLDRIVGIRCNAATVNQITVDDMIISGSTIGNIAE